MIDMLALKDALITDLENNGDLSEPIWKFAKTLKGKTQWLVFEQVQRLIYQLYAGNTITERQALVASSEWLGAFTGRGVGF